MTATDPASWGKTLTRLVDADTDLVIAAFPETATAVDAAAIASYGAFARPVPTPVRAGAREALAETLACRRQLLAEIDSRSFEVALALAQAQLQRDQAQLRNAQLDLDRYKDLLSKDSIARQQVDTQDALVRQLQATVMADQANVDNAKLQLSYTQVAAPIGGRLGLRTVDQGNIVRAGDAAGRQDHA